MPQASLGTLSQPFPGQAGTGQSADATASAAAPQATQQPSPQGQSAVGHLKVARALHLINSALGDFQQSSREYKQLTDIANRLAKTFPPTQTDESLAASQQSIDSGVQPQQAA